jgi:hypothetical protein
MYFWLFVPSSVNLEPVITRAVTFVRQMQNWPKMTDQKY